MATKTKNTYTLTLDVEEVALLLRVLPLASQVVAQSYATFDGIDAAEAQAKTLHDLSVKISRTKVHGTREVYDG